MGHQHLGRLSRSRKWRQVVALINGGAQVRDVAAATSAAAESQMMDASGDAAIRHAVWLLAQIPIAARNPKFCSELQKIGLKVSEQPTLVEVTVAMVDAIDRQVEGTGGRTDLGEMAQLSAVESLNAVAGRELADLFGTSPENTKAALAGLGTEKQFSILARDFFARLCRRQLAFFLSRELSQHVGANGRFNTIRDHRDFEVALDLHCREASRITKEFAGEWFSKHIYQGGITPEKAARFAHVAFKKIREELRRWRDGDA